MNRFLRIITVVPALVDLGMAIADKVRARRAARRAATEKHCEQPPPPPPRARH